MIVLTIHKNMASMIACGSVFLAIPHRECFPAPPTGKELISYMPAGIESVILFDLRALAAQGHSPDRFLRQPIRSILPAGELPQGLEELERLLANASPHHFVHGGSGFMPPATESGLGSGDYRRVAIWLLEQSADMRAVTDRHFKSVGVACGTAIYQIAAQSPSNSGLVPPRHLFLASPRERVIVAADSFNDVQYIIRRINDSTGEIHDFVIPRHWREGASHIDTSSAIVLLRAYNPANWNDITYPQGGCLSLGLSVQLSEATITISAIGDHPKAAMDFYQTLLTRAAGYTWEMREIDSGLRATVRMPEVPLTALELPLRTFFGENLRL